MNQFSVDTGIQFIVPGSASLSWGSVALSIDDSAGHLSGTAGTAVINYQTGVITVLPVTMPANGTTATFDCTRLYRNTSSFDQTITPTINGSGVASFTLSAHLKPGSVWIRDLLIEAPNEGRFPEELEAEWLPRLIPWKSITDDGTGGWIGTPYDPAEARAPITGAIDYDTGVCTLDTAYVADAYYPVVSYETRAVNEWDPVNSVWTIVLVTFPYAQSSSTPEENVTFMAPTPCSMAVGGFTGDYETAVTGLELTISVSPLSISAVAPNTGPTTGGTVISVYGTSLHTVTGITVGGVACTDLLIVSTVEARATTPAGTAGAKTVVATDGAVSSSITGGFCYVASGPTLLSTSGEIPLVGGAFTVFGKNLASTSAVSIGTTACRVDSATSDAVVCFAFALTATGLQDVTVWTDAGTSILEDGIEVKAYPPTVDGHSPATLEAGSTGVLRLSGSHLDSTRRVTIDGTDCVFTIKSEYSIWVETPSKTAGVYALLVQTQGGTCSTSIVVQAIDTTPPGVAPTISSITPSSGPTELTTSVQIAGDNLYGATVTVGGVNAPVLDSSKTALTCYFYAQSAGTKAVVVTNEFGSDTEASGFTYTATAPVVTFISPGHGPTGGGTVLTILGQNLATTSGVTIDGVACTAVTATATQITATAPAGTAGAKDVVVTTGGGSTTTAKGFLYESAGVPSAPTITNISPASGTVAGYSQIIITGTNFVDVSAVTIDGDACSAIVTLSSTAIACSIPPGTAGAKDVVVTTDYGTDTETGGFTYIAPVAYFASVSPDLGVTDGGTSITITGAYFTGATAVTIGGEACTAVTVVDDATITATTPANTTGLKTLVITTASGNSSTSNAFRYYSTAAPAPILQRVLPNYGTMLGGDTIDLYGANFTGTSAITIGGESCTGITVLDSGHVQAVTPEFDTDGAQNVILTTSNGSSTLTNGFTYTAIKPIIVELSPAYILYVGQPLDIRGVNLANATAVTIGGVSVEIQSIDVYTGGGYNGHRIRVLAPELTPGSKTIVVTNPYGTGSTVAR